MQIYCGRANCSVASTVSRASAFHKVVLRLFTDAVLPLSAYVAWT